MAKRTADSLAAAEQHFKEAIELDPDYALAYVGLADTYGGGGRRNPYQMVAFALDRRRMIASGTIKA